MLNLAVLTKSGVEIRFGINVERNNYNEKVNEYNKQVRELPTKLAAMLMGFKTKPTFKAEAGADKAPVVNF